MTFKTIAEQEREEYLTGHVVMAKVLAYIDDETVNQTEYEERIAELDNTIIDLENKISDLDAEIDELKIKLADYE